MRGTILRRMSAGRVPLRTALESPASKRVYVRRLFATIADRYDLITVLLSFGLDRQWKRRLMSLAGSLPGKRALDLACGTGDIAFAFAERGASVVGLDITHRMVEIASAKGQAHSASRTGPLAHFLVGDMMALPFADAQFDVITTGYGLRNVPELAGAIAEIERVLRPGGLLLSLDFNRPRNAPCALSTSPTSPPSAAHSDSSFTAIRIRIATSRSRSGAIRVRLPWRR